MDKDIKELLSLLRKERIIINKLVESDEREDKLLFNSLQEMYKDISKEVDNKINYLLDNKTYDETFKQVSLKLDKMLNRNLDAADCITLLGLINSTYTNRVSNKVANGDSDIFANELVTQVYDIYLWLIKNNDYSKEFTNSLRIDVVNKLVNSRSMRKYFAGDYETAMDISNPMNDEELRDRNKMGIVYASFMLGQIKLSNSFEMYDGVLDEVSFESRKKMLEIEFAAISSIMMKKAILIPPNTMDYSDFTESVIENASDLLNQYNDKKTKEDVKKLIKIITS